MITFLAAVITLIGGYFIYGTKVAGLFGCDNRITPAVEINDGVDFVPMPTWKVFCIQLLNIAGVGPVLGALNGALFGPIVYLWIVFGAIFAGGVHDYIAGMMSMRNRGASLSELTGKYLGNGILLVMRILSVLLLVLVGGEYSNGPAELLAMLTPDKLDANFWLYVIIAYYFFATFVPIDKIIGKFYPLFGCCLIIMALGVGSKLVISPNYRMPELWNNFTNQHPLGIPVWPYLFVTVACGAISGFHATQAPMMARCCKSEREGQLVFYGAMVTEGIIALVWAAAGVSFYESSQALLEAGAGVNAVVYKICTTTMGKVGGLIAMVGVIVCPITSGDTAFRSARLTIADWFKIDQSKLIKRLLITVVLLAVGYLISQLDFSVVWRYFTWVNQTLAVITLWTGAAYLEKTRRTGIICAIPATFMTAVCITYFFAAPECMGLVWSMAKIPQNTYYPIAVAIGIAAAVLCISRYAMLSRKLLSERSE